MKNIFKYSSFLLLTLVLAMSCDDATVGDDEELNYNTGINVVEFTSAKIAVPFVADGDVKQYGVKILASGPDLTNVSGDATVTFSVDPSSTAVSGEHYSLASSTVTLSKDKDFMANIPISVITEDVEAPLVKTLVLNIDSISGTGDNLVVSGNKSQITLEISYSCFADLTGTYTMTNDSKRNCRLPVDVTISANSEGGWYLSTADGGLLQYCSGNDLLNDGNIFVVCGEVIPSDDVAFCGSNGIGCITGGTWDAETGVLILENNNTFFAGLSDYKSTYVRQ